MINVKKILAPLAEAHYDDWTVRIVFSELDRQLAKASKEERLNALREEHMTAYPDVEPKHGAYMAGLTEYIFCLHGESPPNWVNKAEYFLPEIAYEDSIEKLSKNTDSYKKIAIRKAIPQFMRHNIVVEQLTPSTPKRPSPPLPA